MSRLVQVVERLGALVSSELGTVGRFRRRMWRAVRRRAFALRLDKGVSLTRVPNLEHLGTGSGGWVVPVDMIEPGWVCYCIGTGQNISFDLSLYGRFGCTIRACDPAPSERDYVASAAPSNDRFRFLPVGLWWEDADVRMFLPANPDHISLSAANVQDTAKWMEMPCLSLASLMNRFGDRRIDLLKMDLEGAEYEVVPRLRLADLGVQVLCLDLHAYVVSATEALALVDQLASQGFRPVYHRRAFKFTFVAEERLRGSRSDLPTQGLAEDLRREVVRKQRVVDPKP